MSEEIEVYNDPVFAGANLPSPKWWQLWRHAKRLYWRVWLRWKLSRIWR